MSGPAFARLKEAVIGLTGMAYYRDKDARLADLLADRAAQLSLDGWEGYLAHLTEGPEALQEQALLSTRLTIGETYFFRNRGHFDALRATVIPDLLGRNRSSRRLRIWSAGCATGPEPYSIAMLLRTEFRAALTGWRVELLGTDLNPGFLAQARAARYSRWALRATPPEVVASCFHPAPEGFELAPEFRREVTFRRHNLVRDPIPPPGCPGGLDLVMCRNVMIYFDRPTMSSVLQSIREALSPGGWLLVGFSEPDLELFSEFERVSVPGAVLYRKRAWASAPPPVRSVPEVSVVRSVPEVSVPASPRREPPAEPAEPTEPAPPSSGEDCHLHLALQHHERGQPRLRDQALREVLYRDRENLLAHYYRGLFDLQEGATESAGRSFATVRRLLARLSRDRRVTDLEGWTVGELDELVQHHLGQLEPAS